MSKTSLSKDPSAILTLSALVGKSAIEALANKDLSLLPAFFAMMTETVTETMVRFAKATFVLSILGVLETTKLNHKLRKK